MAEGRRERLRKRIRQEGVDGLFPHELLEYMLYPYIPRKDTAGIARARGERRVGGRNRGEPGRRWGRTAGMRRSVAQSVGVGGKRSAAWERREGMRRRGGGEEGTRRVGGTRGDFLVGRSSRSPKPGFASISGHVPPPRDPVEPRGPLEPRGRRGKARPGPRPRGRKPRGTG